MRSLVAFILIISSLTAKADAWDNMTKSQADSVKELIEANPFIFDYCDCCGASVEVYLIKVETVEIIPCSWDDEQYSVHVTGYRIGQMLVSEGGIDDYHTAEPINQLVEYTVFMNYTFVFDNYMNWAVPIFKMVDYHLDGPICFGATNYPNPKDEGVQISDQDYIDWYAKHFTSPGW